MEVGRGLERRSFPSTTPAASMWQATVPTTCIRTKVVQRRPDSLALLPISWDIVVSIYRELVSLINRLPFSKKLVVCVVFRGSRIRLDLGEVKAAGVVCLIGLGLSLGTLLLYRLYFRIIVPFLHSVWATKGKDSLLDDEYTLYLESSDSEVDKMGNPHSKKAIPSVYYAPGYGVSLGPRPPTLDVELEDDAREGIRLRPRKSHRQKSPSPGSDKDSAIGGLVGSEMSQSLYSENSTNRDSFYSTAESGYEEFGYMDDYRSASKLSSSLKENHSPNSLKERNLNMLFKAHHGYDAGLNSIGHSVKPGLDTLSDCSSEKSGIVSSRSYKSSGSSSRDVTVRTNVDPLVEKYAAELAVRAGSGLSQNSTDKTTRSLPNGKILKPIDNTSDSTSYSPKLLSTESSPCHRKSHTRVGKGSSPFRSIHTGHLHQSKSQHGADSEDWDYDPSLDASESIRSFNSSEIDWDADMDSKDKMSALPELHRSDSIDVAFKQSLIQRIQQWSDFADEYQKSRSPTPEIPQTKFIRRSRSLDRHLGDPSSILVSDAAHIVAVAKPTEIEPTTEKNLESLEYELHDIQGEFESITSKLHELIENVTTPTTSSKKHPPDGPQRAQSKPRPIDSKMRTKWEHVPSSVCSDSEDRSSRASSVEYAWDLADYGHLNRHRSDSLVSKDMAVEIGMAGFTQEVSIMNIFDPVIIADYAEEQWKGSTDKAKTVKEGYCKVPQLLSCHRMSVIRGDNYCALRSVLFQVLANGLRVTQHWSGIIGIMDHLHKMNNDPTVSLSNWSFANRLPDHCDDKLGSLYKCALSLYATIEEVCSLPSHADRVTRTISVLNTNETLDLELMEGLKVMMLMELWKLRVCIDDEEDDVPIFAQLLFARDTSLTVSDFLKNHLNLVGDTGGLEQVEMCLLGHTLGLRVRVLRLSLCGQEDFDCLFPDDSPPDWPEVALIAEDDRHYNVPLP